MCAQVCVLLNVCMFVYVLSLMHTYIHIFVHMGGKWLHSHCFVEWCFQDFNIAFSILVQFPSSFFLIHFVSIHVVQVYSSIDTTGSRKKFHFILLDRSDFNMIDNLSIAVHTFARCILILLSVDETLLPRYMNLSTNFRGLPFRVEMAHSQLKHTYSILSIFTWKPMLPAACSRLCSRDMVLMYSLAEL